MTEAEKQEFLACIENTIDKKVNGKIDSLHVKVDAHNEKHEADMVEVRAHMVEVKPYLDGAKGVKVLGNAWKWVMSLGISAAVIKVIWPT